MRIYFILAVFAPFFDTAQITECKDLKEGIFHLSHNSIYSITRTKTKQVEKDQKTGLQAELQIKWISECVYLLFNAKITKPDGSIINQTDTVYNEIISITRNRYKVKSWMPGSDFVSESEIIKVGSK